MKNLLLNMKELYIFKTALKCDILFFSFGLKYFGLAWIEYDIFFLFFSWRKKKVQAGFWLTSNSLLARVRQPTPLHLPPGLLVRFKSSYYN